MRLLLAAALALLIPVTAAADPGDPPAVERAKEVMLTDPSAANREATLAFNEAKEITSPIERSRALSTAMWLKGEALLRLNDIGKASLAIKRALGLSTNLPGVEKLRGDILLSSGGVHQASGEVTAALHDYQAAFHAFVVAKYMRGQAKSLTLIASLYNDANDTASAFKYFDQAISISKYDSGIQWALLNNKGITLVKTGQYAAAEIEFNRALSIAGIGVSPSERGSIYGNIATARVISGDVSGASRALAAAKMLLAKSGIEKLDPHLIAIEAEIALRRHDLNSAKTLIDRAFAEEIATTPLQREAHQTAYDIYSATGDDKLALQHLAALKRLDDQATALATSTNAALAAARFDFANQEIKIQRLRNEQLQRSVAYEQARARTQRYVFLSGTAATALVIALLSIGLITIRRSRNEVRAANDDLAYTNAELGKALAAKTEFLATTSHEIRTPLNGILGMTQVMLADRRLDDGARDRLKVVHDAGVTMRELVDDILDVAKMETGNLTIEEAPVDLAATMGDATRLWEAQASAKGLSFTRELADAPGTVMGDAARLRQIVFNLLSNAVKFTAAGGVALRVARAGDDRFRISVTDTGIGIPADKREAIFETFRQADTSTTRQFGGTGLGLAICRNLVRAMGGEIWVASEPGAGSTFIVELPLVETAPATADAPVVAGPRLLILDRNPIARSMLRTVAKPHVAQVTFAATLDEALAAIVADGADRTLADEATLRAGGDPVSALQALIGAGKPVTVLWPATDEDGLVRARDVADAQVIAKPIAGAALAGAMFGDIPPRDDHQPLVTRAA